MIYVKKPDGREYGYFKCPKGLCSLPMVGTWLSSDAFLCAWGKIEKIISKLS
jgi:hypothetical protein